MSWNSALQTIKSRRPCAVLMWVLKFGGPRVPLKWFLGEKDRVNLLVQSSSPMFQTISLGACDNIWMVGGPCIEMLICPKLQTSETACVDPLSTGCVNDGISSLWIERITEGQPADQLSSATTDELEMQWTGRIILMGYRIQMRCANSSLIFFSWIWHCKSTLQLARNVYWGMALGHRNKVVD